MYTFSLEPSSVMRLGLLMEARVRRALSKDSM
jgi:hypothetical protein